MPQEPARPGAADALEDQLDQSSQVFLTEIDRLRELEHRKRALPATDEARPRIAREVEDIVIGLLSLSRYQTRLIDLESEAAGHARVPRPPSAILDDWRAAERRLHLARTSLDRASDETDRLRDEHRESLRSRTDR